MAIRTETELYAPVKKFWEERGYVVRGEVQHCDLVAMRDGEMIVVELKRGFSVPLLVQGIDRQRLTDRVYMAIELPQRGRAPHRLQWSEVRRLCELLSLGLLTVRFYKTKREPLVEVVCHPPARSTAARPAQSVAETTYEAAANTAYATAETVREAADAVYATADAAHGAAADTAYGAAHTTADAALEPRRTPAKRVRISPKAAKRVAAEFASRHGDFNVGGSPGSKRRVTAYRERSLLCAAALQAARGPLPLRELRERTGCAGVSQLMQHNVYGWFHRHQRGVYALTPEGEAALTTYHEVVSVIARDLVWDES